MQRCASTMWKSIHAGDAAKLGIHNFCNNLHTAKLCLHHLKKYTCSKDELSPASAICKCIQSYKSAIFAIIHTWHSCASAIFANLYKWHSCTTAIFAIIYMRQRCASAIFAINHMRQSCASAIFAIIHGKAAHPPVLLFPNLYTRHICASANVYTRQSCASAIFALTLRVAKLRLHHLQNVYTQQSRASAIFALVYMWQSCVSAICKYLAKICIFCLQCKLHVEVACQHTWRNRYNLKLKNKGNLKKEAVEHQYY